MAERYTKEELANLGIDAEILANEIEAQRNNPDYFLTPRQARIFGNKLKGERGKGLKSDFMLGNTLVRVKRRERPQP